jgi:hypothetical protein
VLAVGLGKVEALHVGRVALEVFDEEVVVVLDVPGIQPQAQLRVDRLKSLDPLFDERDGLVGFRRNSRLESG